MTQHLSTITSIMISTASASSSRRMIHSGKEEFILRTIFRAKNTDSDANVRLLHERVLVSWPVRPTISLTRPFGSPPDPRVGHHPVTSSSCPCNCDSFDLVGLLLGPPPDKYALENPKLENPDILEFF